MPHDKARGLFLDRPGRREAAGRHWLCVKCAVREKRGRLVSGPKLTTGTDRGTVPTIAKQ